jgi:hypothetical protein
VPTPSSAVAPALHAVLEIWAEFIEEILLRQTELLAPSAMSLAVNLLEQDRSKLSRDNADLLRLIDASSMARRNISGALQGLLESDPHLMSTCRTRWAIARALEQLGLDAASQALTPNAPKPNLTELASSLIERLFEEEYRRGSIFHIYNVDLPPAGLSLGSLGAVLMRLPPEEVALLTNEATASSRIHGVGLGNTFIRFVDGGEGDDWRWMAERRQDAYKIVRVLRFLRYQIVDLDWGGIHYSPEWVNAIRKYGITIWGRPRWDVQPTRFTLDEEDQRVLLQYLAFYTAHLPEIDDMQSDLRKAMSIAGNYYESHHGRLSSEDKLIDLVISLEALFSPSREGELRFRIAQRGALLLGADAAERRRIFALLRRAYDARSALVHGGDSPFQSAKFTADDLTTLGEAVRVAVLRLLTLHMRGYRKRDAVLGWLDECALDPERHQKLTEEADFHKYLSERS